MAKQFLPSVHLSPKTGGFWDGESHPARFASARSRDAVGIHMLLTIATSVDSITKFHRWAYRNLTKVQGLAENSTHNPSDSPGHCRRWGRLAGGWRAGWQDWSPA